MSHTKEFEKIVRAWAKRSLEEQPTGEARQLPFVYQLTHNGVESIAIGTNHSAPDCYAKHCQELAEGKKYVLTENLQRKGNFFDRYNQFCLALNLIMSYSKTRARFNRMKEEGRYRLAEDVRANISQNAYGTPYPLSIEARIFEAAKIQGIPVKGLETIPEMEGQAPRISTPITPPYLLATWINGSEYIMQCLDVSNFTLMLDAATPAQRKYQKGRNKKMVNRSLPYLETPSLIAVGAAHLCGSPPTMLDIYQEKGIKIKRI